MNIYLKLAREEAKSKALESENNRLKANLDYVAMMTEVDIPTEDEDAQPEI